MFVNLFTGENNVSSYGDWVSSAKLITRDDVFTGYGEGFFDDPDCPDVVAGIQTCDGFIIVIQGNGTFYNILDRDEIETNSLDEVLRWTFENSYFEPKETD